LIGICVELEVKVVVEEVCWFDIGLLDDVFVLFIWGGYLVWFDVIELWVG